MGKPISGCPDKVVAEVVGGTEFDLDDPLSVTLFAADNCTGIDQFATREHRDTESMPRA